MSIYTVIHDHVADQVIEHELRMVVEKICNYFGEHVEAILLTGGFGRGEGGVVWESDHFRPVNDYDIAVVVKKRKNIPIQCLVGLHALEEELNKIVSVKQVDLAILETFELSLPYPTIARFEIKYGHKLLYSKKPLIIRSIPSRFIPLYEGTKYFRTRCGGLLVARLLLDGQGNFSENERVEYSSIEISKAFIAMGDCYLIQHHLYDISYVQRIHTIEHHKALLNIPENIMILYINAIEKKLRPKFDRVGLKETVEEWNQVRSIYINEFLRFESIRLNEQYCTLDQYSLVMMKDYVLKKDILSVINIENSPTVVNNRIELFNLLDQFCEKATLDLSSAVNTFKKNEKDFDWHQLTLKKLKEWHPAGIISKF